MTAVKVVLPAEGPRRWHRLAVDRLAAAGHDVVVATSRTGGRRNRLLETLLAAERRIRGTTQTSLTAPIPAFDAGGAAGRPCRLVLDLSEGAGVGSRDAPVLAARFQGQPDFTAAAAVLCRGDVPVVDLYLDGEHVAHAAPMSYGRSFVSRGLDDVVARAITLLVDFVNRYEAAPAGRARAAAPAATATPATSSALARAYLSSALPRLARKALRNLRYHGAHWRVGYRLHDGPGVAETLSLGGLAWSVLPDDGDRFYADPFPVDWEGRQLIFVEELVHARGKGVIAVSERGPDGVFGTPRQVLEEPWHLSYPQVFAHDGEMWMIPESGAGRQLVLYRAREFPDRWVRHRVLLAGREVFDATLLRHEGLFWLLGTERDGAGNASDTMAVFFAERLEGPWRPHPENPVLVDRSAARPGGAFARLGERIVLPVQDGSAGYGGGLGLSELVRLDPEHVELSPPVPIDPAGDWPYPLIHTLNRHGRLECIDGMAQVPRRGVRR